FMAMAFETMDIPAVSLNAYQAKIHTTKEHGNAKITNIETDRIFNELEQRKIVIVTGFQGIAENNDITTLGRGGSDTTAVALAAALGADACEIYTDVDGVYTEDPRKVPTARKLAEISYDDMLYMALNGAQVLHSRCVEIAKKFGIPLVVRSSMNRTEGTVVRDREAVA
ncbi:MAG: aspartate kinase, partial [Anaerotignum sp.]|nr:aspartate kinase [Anaerotignum sp.]